MSTPTLARAPRSPIAHDLVPGTKLTRCGRDATLMARWAPSDNRVDSRIWRRCQACQTH